MINLREKLRDPAWSAYRVFSVSMARDYKAEYGKPCPIQAWEDLPERERRAWSVVAQTLLKGVKRGLYDANG